VEDGDNRLRLRRTSGRGRRRARGGAGPRGGGGGAAAAPADAGHDVVEADPPYPADLAATLTARWVGAVPADAEGLDRRLLSPRIRGMARAGRLAQRVRPSTAAEAEAVREVMDAWFLDHDLLVTPVLARPQLRVGALHRRGWLLTVLVSARYAPFTGAWNLVGYPALAVPAGTTRGGLPLGVQLVAPRGREDVLLGVAAQLEQRRPWPRLASGARRRVG
jgi:amidase